MGTRPIRKAHPELRRLRPTRRGFALLHPNTDMEARALPVMLDRNPHPVRLEAHTTDGITRLTVSPLAGADTRHAAGAAVP